MLPRYARWDYFLGRSLERPWFGHGVVSDAAAFEALEGVAVSPHNTYLQIAMARGWPAALVLALCTVRIVLDANAISRLSSQREKGLGGGLLGGAIGAYCLGAMFDPLYEDSQIGVVFWLVMAAARVLRESGSWSPVPGVPDPTDGGSSGDDYAAGQGWNVS